MMFPSSARVRYGRSPLVQVICQLRFPAILTIDRDAPTDFQDALRATMPGYQRVDVSSLAIVAGGQQIALSPEAGSLDRRVEHVFLSADGQMRATLGRDFVALLALSYPGWEAFSGCLDTLVTTLEGTYKPAYFERAGLRYQNVIRRSVLGLEQSRWQDLLRPSIAGLLTEPGLAPRHVVTEAMFDLDQPLRARIAHGLIQADGEEAYLVDTDFFVEGRESLTVVRGHIDRLHEQAGRVFRWCIKDALHNAMAPEAIR